MLGVLGQGALKLRTPQLADAAAQQLEVLLLDAVFGESPEFGAPGQFVIVLEEVVGDDVGFLVEDRILQILNFGLVLREAEPQLVLLLDSRLLVDQLLALLGVELLQLLDRPNQEGAVLFGHFRQRKLEEGR
jgi:hypothetical protein